MCRSPGEEGRAAVWKAVRKVSPGPGVVWKDLCVCAHLRARIHVLGEGIRGAWG